MLSCAAETSRRSASPNTYRSPRFRRSCRTVAETSRPNGWHRLRGFRRPFRAGSPTASTMSPLEMPGTRDDASRQPDRRRHASAPWKWESLLVESAVIGGSNAGRDGSMAWRSSFASDSRADGRRTRLVAHSALRTRAQNLEHLRAFALPLVETISEWPDQATWGDWLQRLEGFAPRSFGSPSTCCECWPIATDGRIGPVSLTEVRDVLADRLLSLEVEPPANRYGRVFVGSRIRLAASVQLVSAPGRRSACSRRSCARIRCCSTTCGRSSKPISR